MIKIKEDFSETTLQTISKKILKNNSKIFSISKIN